MVQHSGPSSASIGSQAKGQMHTPTMGTPDYMPPEVRHSTERVEGRRTPLISQLLHSLRVALHRSNLFVFATVLLTARLPQVLAGKVDSGMSSDTYSYGVLVNEMASRQRPWAHLPVEHIAARPYAISVEVTSGNRPQLAKNLDPVFQALIEECWAEDPGDRPAFGADEGEAGVIARIRNLTAFQRTPLVSDNTAQAAVVSAVGHGTLPSEPEPQPADVS
jgi:serine/threonine protein kinase|eukprot:COSAG02_NODE_1690_length_11299_cov_21.781071_10_plen_220_part_00